MNGKIFFLCCTTVFLFSLSAATQNTTGSMGGIIKTNNGQKLAGATIKALHEPTGTMFFSQATRAGIFNIDNLTPGGPYTVEVSFINYSNEKKSGIYVNLGEQVQVDFSLTPEFSPLEKITVSSIRKNNGWGKTHSQILEKDKLNFLPSASRNLHEYLTAIPHATTIGSNEGAISFAGQNNRYNTFYIDGAVNNDVFGLAASGTNGGQAGISPISIDAIEQLQVVISPYDASVGNFTGAGINAITRSGTNRTEGSLYYFFSNESLTGKAPATTKEKMTAGYELYRKISGMRLQGAIKKNKIFYFINTELQRERYPQPFVFNEYKGNTKNSNNLFILANSVRSNYGYDAGSFLDNPETLNTDRIVTRIDWNINKRHKVSVSNRYTYGQRVNTNASNANTIHFSNDGFALFSTTWASSLEWKSIIGRHTGNKLSVTYADVTDDRAPAGRAFPRVRINDGEGAFIFGTDNSSTINLLAQKNWTLSDKIHFTMGKHSWSAGIDGEYNQVFNAFIQNSFGNYTYASLSDFLTRAAPSVYQLGFSLIDSNNNDHTAAAARFAMMKASVFVNDEFRLSENCMLHFGIRMDQYTFLTKPMTNDYVNDVAIPKFTEYWQVQPLISGRPPNIQPSVSPRIGFLFRSTPYKLLIRVGMGIFSGRVPLAWPGGVYNNNGIVTGGYMANASQLHRIRFRPDPYRQWQAGEIGAVINKEPLNLMAASFRMPSLLRTSLVIEKSLGNNWSLSSEAILSKNLSEINYTNSNLLPPVDHAKGPDNRSVYTLVNHTKIPLNADSSNPYDYAIILGNNSQNKGYAYNFSTTLAKRLSAGWSVELNYGFGHSVVWNEGTSSVNVSQWRSMETVNGRNYLTRSHSDFSAGHRIFAWVNRKFTNTHKTMSTSISVSYRGQSGSPFSYVYNNNSVTRDDGRAGFYDLLYVPTTGDLADMIFLPNTVNGITYTAQQQKEALETYISLDSYLQNRRGNYAERNGSRTPFTHVIDLKITQDIILKFSHKNYRVQLTCDLFNAANFINPNWGKKYFQPNDNFSLIDFVGYLSETDLTPQYRFDPGLLLSTPWKTSNSKKPAYSAYWSCQLGLRLTF